jgi:hypothetical protein
MMMKETEKARRQRLLGPLAEVLSGERFRERVLVSASLRFRSAVFPACLEHPRWATLEVLDLEWQKTPWFIGKMGSFLGALSALHTVKGLSAKLMPEVACPRINRLSVEAGSIAAIRDAFPAITSLEVVGPCEASDLFWDEPFVRALSSVTIEVGNCRFTWTGSVLRLDQLGGWGAAHAIHWIDDGPALTRVELGEGLRVQSDRSDLKIFLEAARLRGAQDVPKLRVPKERWCSECGAPAPWEGGSRSDELDS